ncbi:hypothetical protein [Roseateles saccharophilus]|uniref:Uncharacterized protein n=1 Tax=Roseateles saccharophilus TaxID=304 RepID=A0A4V2VT12_ROSSA|nr:hypothetical protein [Roseateles saccharophilus]MDG0831302.1 hypothetical protein [Roseateles saccharophilus]TCV04430.1 hypothetical protein EV671_1001185 [Roseateles saccharophilus]
MVDVLKRIFVWLLSLVGAVPASQLEASETTATGVSSELEESRKNAEQLQNKLTVAKEDLVDANAQLDLAEWTDHYLVELSPVYFPRQFVLNTWQLWQAMTGRRGRLGDPALFRGGIHPAGLYWALTQASLSGSKAIDQAKNEDGMTADFVHALESELANAQKHIGSVVNVAVGHIFQNRKPALKEVSVGADLLILVSGTGLVPRGGVRLFWVQMKQADDPSSMVMDVYREPNAAGGTQLEALRAVHVPGSGSFGLYAMGSASFWFFASTTVDKLAQVMPKVASTCKIDLGDGGTRFQETLLRLAGDSAHGEFSTSAAVLKFVDDLAAQQSIVPLTVLGISAGREVVPVKSLVAQAKALWEQRLVEHRQQLSKDLPPQIEREGGPSLDR